MVTRKSEFTEEQIAFALRQAEAWTTVDEICRKLGVTQATFCRRKKKYAGMGASELRRLRQVEEENRKLKQLVADLSLDKHMLVRLRLHVSRSSERALRPARKRELAKEMTDEHRVSQRRACRVIGLWPRTMRYESMKDRQDALRMRLRDLAAARVRYGYRRLSTISGAGSR
jgi:putative transposase